MTIIFYVYSCVGLELITKSDWSLYPEADTIVQYQFSTLFRFMLTLMQFSSFDSCAAIYIPMMLAGGTYEMFITGVFFVSYLLIVGIALMNLLMAIIVEGSMEQSRNDVEVAQQLKSEMMKKYLPKLYQAGLQIRSLKF